VAHELENQHFLMREKKD